MRCVNLPAVVTKLMHKQVRTAKLADQAQTTILALVDRRPYQVLYEQQLQLLFESYWSHKTTTNALRALQRDERISTERVKYLGGLQVRFFWSLSLTDAACARGMEGRLALLRWSAGGNIGRRIGAHLERLVIAAFKAIDGTVLSVDANSCGGRVWQGEEQHRLDSCVKVGEQRYGVEVKNMLDYPDAKEIRLKCEIAGALGTRPVLVTRAAPASWDAQYQRLGGFIWRLGRQVYPSSRAKAARTLRRQNGLPIEVCDELSVADCRTLRGLVEASSSLPIAA